jgi:hypothetical protein
MDSKLFIIRGSSSFLFVIPVIIKYNIGNYLGSFFNALLIASSFLYNGSYYSIKYETFDFVVLLMIAMHYINNLVINNFLLIFGLYEYKRAGTIKYTKDLSLGMASIKGLVLNYMYSDILIFYILLISIIYGSVIFKVRQYSYYRLNGLNNLLFTYLFHICATNILCISN